MGARLVIVFLLVAFAACAAAGTAPVRHSPAENQLLSALQQIRNSQQQRALDTLRELLKERPDFKLARYLYGQMLTSLAGGAVAAGQRAGADVMLSEARRRWQHYQSRPPMGAVPSAILHLAPGHAYAIVVDLPHNRLYLFENDDGQPRLVADFYASIGSAGAGKQVEGDLRTPVGIYRITSFIPDRQLPSLYGGGAFTLNYPNAWDRHLGRTGYGIWLHGVPRQTFNRAPRASEGCVVVANSDLRWLYGKVAVGATPVVLTNDLQWLTPQEARRRYQAVMDALAVWQTNTVIAEGVAGATEIAPLNLAAPPPIKKQSILRVDATSRPVQSSALSVFAYPGEPDLVLTMAADAGEGSSAMTFWRNQGDSGDHAPVLYAGQP